MDDTECRRCWVRGRMVRKRRGVVLEVDIVVEVGV